MFPGTLAVLLVLSAATPVSHPACGMAGELKAIAATNNTSIAFRRAAALLAQQGKWRAAATAQESAASDDASRLLHAFYVLRSGELARAEKLLRDLAPTAGAHWIAAELALERNDAETAAEELDAARAEAPAGDAFRSICCGGRTIDSPAIDLLLRARVALLRDDAARSARLLREVRPPDGRLFFARALKMSGRTAEAVRELETLGRELPPCAGVWREHVLFEAALAASEIDPAAAEKLYQDAIDAAEEQEEAFTTTVREAHVDLQTPVTGLFVAAMREPRHAAPESHNNLGHLLLARANGELATLAVTQAELRKAAQSRDYATPQYAYIGLARAALAAGEPSVAASEVMNALWRAPQHDEALELARILIRDAPIESRLGLGVAFSGITSEALPRRFVTREYGLELAQLDAVAATHDDELARHYETVRALAKRDFEQARRLAKAARAKYSSSDWPDAVQATALIATGSNEEAETIYRALAERVARNPPRTPWDAATLRTAALAFPDLAKGGDDPAAALIAEVARPAVALGRPFPWESRTGLTGSVTSALDAVSLPAATITLFTETGPQTETTNANGQWRAKDLPPGFYSVLAEREHLLSSGRIVEVKSGETEVAFALKAGPVAETMTVTSEVVMIDPLPGLTRKYDPEVQSLPVVSRNSLANFQIDGASSADNSFFIDGVNVTDASLTTSVDHLLLSSAIEELSVITSGYSAEFGHDSMNVVSMVSRSGTNEFDGKVSVEAARDVEEAEPVAMSRAMANERDEEILRFQASGPLQRDLLFWFASGNLQQEHGKAQPALRPELTLQGESSGRKLDVFAKLSGSLTTILGSLSANAHHEYRDGVVEDPGGSAFGTASSTGRRQKLLDDTLILAIEKIIGTTLAGVNASRTRVESSLRPGREEANAIQLRIPEAGFFTAGGVGFINDGRDFERTTARARISMFLFGSHQLVAGVDAARDDDALSDRISGGLLVDGERGLYRFWTFGDDPQPVPGVHETFQGDETSAYISDTWTLSRFTMLAGLRWTKENVHFPRELELATSGFQPRLGISVDPLGDSRWKIYANYGRFLDPIRRDERVAYGSDRRYAAAPSGPHASPFEAESYGRLSAIDPDLRARLSDTWGAGVEHGHPWYWQLGAQYRRLASHIEDFFCTADRMRCIGNPGSGIMRTLQSEEGGLRQSPRARREHLYLIGRIWRRPRSSYWELAYTWLRAKGNTEPPDLASTRVAGIDPYARSAFDFAELVSNGALALPRHSLTANAFRTFQDVVATHDLVLAAALSARSGVPRGAFGYSPLYGRYVRTHVSRGEQSDGPARVSLDVGIDYIVPISDKSELKLSLSGRNLFGSQTSRIDDQRALLPLSDRGETIPNPTFLQPMERDEPRSLRASVAWSF